MKKSININNWLKGNCCYKGCLNNDGFGICLVEDTEFVDEMLDLIHESYKDNEPIPDDKTFICKNMDFENNTCIYCGEELKEHKEYPTSEKQFLPVVYNICANDNCKGSGI